MKYIKKEKIFTESKRLVSVSVWRRRVLFWGGGLLVGLICVLFAKVCDFLNFGFEIIAKEHPFLPFFVTPIGFMLIVFIMRTWFKGTEGSGIPQVMAALKTKNIKTRNRLVSLRIVIGKFFLTALGFIAGGSIGREGPTIQLSASIMHILGRMGKFHRHDVERGLLLAGGAAGIAAAFNTPLAGIVFAIEELSGSFEKGVSGTIITTVVLSGIVAQGFLGNYSYFGSSTATISMLTGWHVLAITAVLAGIFGGLFSWSLIKISGLMKKIVSKHPIWIAGLLGLVVAIIGFVSGGATYGSGYEAAKGLLTHANEHVDASYGILKLISTLLTYLSGIPGGIFAPSLSVGAGLGEWFAAIFPSQFHSAVVIIATVAYFSGVVQSPITTFVIVSEMTNNTSGDILLPIMLASIIGTAVSKVICREPLYHALAARYLEMIRQKKLQEKKDALSRHIQ